MPQQPMVPNPWAKGRREFLQAAAGSLLAGSALDPGAFCRTFSARTYRSRIAYSCNGEIHINIPGQPEGTPLTSGHWDFKPSWSRTGDLLVFFRRLEDHPDVSQWITAICVIRVDGTGFHQLSDGTATDFNPTWTRDGQNTPVWNRKNPATGTYYVVASHVEAKPGEEIPLSGKHYHCWVHSAVTDGRLVVFAAPPKCRSGYYLMTPKPPGEPEFEPIACELAQRGYLDRLSVSPSQTMICFEFQPREKGRSQLGRTLYVAEFDLGRRRISDPRPIANEEGQPFWVAYPRWIEGGSAVIYHSSLTGRCQLYVYDLVTRATERVSTNPKADYRYPHGEAAPC
jgi:hypothetical protein